MPVTFTDADIDRLILEKKLLPSDYQDRFKVRPKRGHHERDIDITGEEGSTFRVILRLSLIDPLSFSAILAVYIPNTTTLFRLRRYNGRHEHTNHLEEQKFYDFHIHQATERYQDSPHSEDAYAEPTTRYQDFRGAQNALLVDCGFVFPNGMIQSEWFG